MLWQNMENVSSNHSYPQDFLRIKRAQELIPLDFNTRRKEEYNDEIHVNELRSALKTCHNTAPGKDGIHYAMLKNLSDGAIEMLLVVYNRVFLEGLFPSVWSEAILLPFLKPSKDPHEPSSYRPIALTSCVCKVLEKIINARLSCVLDGRDLLTPYQYGFRKMRNTLDTLVRLESHILVSFARKKQLVAVLFDIEKAYATTWKYNILGVIHRFGIRGPMAFFIGNFLKNRTFQVKIGSCKSVPCEQEQGTPQGSVLSCTLFSIAINDIVKDVPDDICKSLTWMIWLYISHLRVLPP
uniref:RNA-directed DNA polymerase from transposon X-element n=1 Tax=Hirondellea gigas TaxID=1518452 RepID=A0A2P2I3D6_9CRUS